MPSSTTLSWYALTVRPNHEQLAERALRGRGMEPYLPLHRVRRRWSDRLKDLETVLFPGYLFCRFARGDKLRVLTAPGVRSIVSVGRDPLPVDDSEVEAVRVLVDCGRPIDVYPYIRIGRKVRIQHGPFASLRGEILRTNDAWRVVVSVEALGCSASVELDADQILPDYACSERLTHGGYQT